MTQQIIQALNAKYIAEKLEAIANLNNYFTNSAGIGEHPDIVSECDKLLRRIADADGYISALQTMIQSSNTPAPDQQETIAKK